jgi:hypothetical protein
MRNIIIGGLLIGILFLYGCATIALLPDKTIVKNRVFVASYEEVWGSMIPSLTSSGEVVTIAQKDSGLFCFKRYLEAREVEELALAPGKITFLERPVLKVNVVITKVDDKHTNVAINSEITGSFKKDFTTWCASKLESNGVTERNCLDRIQENLKSNKTVSLDSGNSGDTVLD